MVNLLNVGHVSTLTLAFAKSTAVPKCRLRAASMALDRKKKQLGTTVFKKR